MKIKRVFAKDMRTALAEVKELLGPDAVIMSNKKVTGGIEIVAAVGYQPESSAMDSIPPTRAMKEDQVALSSNRSALEAGDRPDNSSLRTMSRSGSPSGLSGAGAREAEPMANSLGELLARQSRLVREQNTLPPTLAEQSKTSGLGGSRSPSSSARTTASSNNRNTRDVEMEAMRAEMASIRKLLQHQLSGLMWQEVERREPIRALVIKHLTKAGFTEHLADQLAGMIPEDISSNEAMQMIRQVLTDQLQVGNDDILRLGGAVALVGPTGVGKTTTTAKLAARFAMKYGVEQVAMISTDHYRIGAQEQLQTYGRIMGCQVKTVSNSEELNQAIYQLRNRRLVLIDTAGMGQRDVRLQEQLQDLMQKTQVKINHYLVLPATAQRRVLQDAYDQFSQIPLTGCILSKLDECLNLADILDVCIRNQLPISYLTNGQRVPEDIQLPQAQELISLMMQQLDHVNGQPYYWNSDPEAPTHAEFYE